MRPELQAIHDTYVAAAGDHTDLPKADVYLRESRAQQVDGFSPGAQPKGCLDEAARRREWVPTEHVFLDLMSGRREDRVAFQDIEGLGQQAKRLATRRLLRSTS